MERLVGYGCRGQRVAGDAYTHSGTNTDVSPYTDTGSYANSDADADGIIVAGAVRRSISR